MVLYEGQTIKLNLLKCYEIRIEAFIGNGGGGDVYKARDTQNRNVYAFKHIRVKDKHTVETIIEKVFSLGKEACISIDSPLIIQCYGMVRLDDFDFGLLNEFVEGFDLKDWLKKYPRLAPEKRLALFVRVVEAVKTLHDNRIVHHDLKPQNIIITKNNIPKIIDFGTMKVIDKDISNSKELKGTLAYIAPENYVGMNTDLRFDLFSLGSLLYEIYRQKNYFEICGFDVPPMEKMVVENGSVTGNIIDFDPGFPKETLLDKRIASIIKKATAFDPGKRYADINKLLADIFRLPVALSRTRAPISSPAPSEPRRPTGRTVPPNPVSLRGERKIKRYKTLSNILFLFLFLSISVLGLLFSSNNELKKGLEQYKSYKSLYDVQLRQNHSLTDEIKYVKQKLKSTRSDIGKLKFQLGKMISIKPGGYDNGYKLAFSVKKPIVLNSVDVRANKEGKITLQLCNRNGKVLRTSRAFNLAEKLKWYRLEVGFRVEPGNYFLQYFGTPSLYYSSDNVNFPYQLAGIVQIESSLSKSLSITRRFYQYFYNWSFSLVVE